MELRPPLHLFVVAIEKGAFGVALDYGRHFLLYTHYGNGPYISTTGRIFIQPLNGPDLTQRLFYRSNDSLTPKEGFVFHIFLAFVYNVMILGALTQVLLLFSEELRLLTSMDTEICLTLLNQGDLFT